MSERPTKADDKEAISQGACSILRERQRQVLAEGWTPDHDDEHHNGTLRIVAAQLAVEGTSACVEHPDMPRDPWGLAAKHTNAIRRLEIAGALIAAEIDRMRRAGYPHADD